MNDHGSSSAGLRWLHHPRQLRVRRGIAFGHMVCGIAVGIILLTLGLSGSLLVFKDQLEPRLYPQLLQSSPASPLISTDELLASAMAGAKDLRPLLIDLGTQPAAAIYLSHGSWFPGFGVRVVYVDRGTGRVRGSRLYSEGLFNKLMHLHTELFLGERGSQVLGGVAIVVLLMTLSGYLLWWPGKRGWKRATRIDWKARWPRLNWDLHNAVGFFAGPFLILQGATALGLTLLVPVLGNTVPKIIEEISQFDNPPRSLPTHDRDRAPRLESMVLKSVRNHPEMQFKSIALPIEQGDSIVVTLGSARYEDRGSQARLAFDRNSGALLSDLDSDRGSRVLRLYVMLRPLHYGRVAGLWSEVLWAGLGFTPLLLFVSGFAMWWRRIPAKYMGNMKARSIR